MARSYRGVPAEQRREERRERLMEAALDVMGTEGWSATSVREVCRRARLTPRFFYESFPDLESLALAVFDAIVADATAKVFDALAAADDDDLDAQARAAIAAFVGALTDDPRRGRVAFVEALGSERLMERRLATTRAFAAIVAARGKDAYGAPARAAPLVDLTASVLVGGLAEVLMSWLRGDLAMDRDTLVEDFAALFVATGEAAAAISRERARRRRPVAGSAHQGRGT